MGARVVRCRLTCELSVEGRVHRAIAVNLSTTGLFVQTSASFPVETELELRIYAVDDRPELRARAKVSRVKKVHPGAQVVVARGMGLELIDPGSEWNELVARMGCTSAEAAPPAGDPSFGLPHFRVVLRRMDGIRIRTRVVKVACVSPAEARAGVEADVEEGWEIVKVERQSIRPGSELERCVFRVVAGREGGSRRWEASFEAVSAEEARQEAARDLGPAFQIELVERLTATPDADKAKPLPAVEKTAEGRQYQVSARLEEDSRIRTRVAKLRAASPEEAARRVLEKLGPGWQAVKVTPI